VSPAAGILVIVKRNVILIAAGVCVLAGAVAAAVLLGKNSTPSGPTAATHKTAAKSSKPAFNKKQQSLTDPTSSWVLVNKQHPLNPATYAPSDLVSVGNGQQMRAEAATALQHMFTDAQAAGYTLVADSGYRSYATQVSTYNSIVTAYGQSYADTVSARPSYSEHQTGWAVDIGTGSCHVQDCFGATPGGKWTQANAYKYGFLLRYPESLTSITGYSNEAWHFRYVGVALSTELYDTHMQTLEQFFGVSGGTTYKQ
jgi:D-alanyl-D-alanine carboxypeptidase